MDSNGIAAVPVLLGLALTTLAMFGASACSTDGTASDGNTTTSDGTTTNTTADDTSDSGMTDTETDTSDSSDDTVPEDVAGSGVCDPWMQDCPEGEKCVPWASMGGTWDDNKCVPLLGTDAPGAPCSYSGPIVATDSCGPESVCWFAQEVDGELFGVCTPFCGGTPDDPVCADGSSCVIANAGSINLCLQTCDPLGQDCPDGLGCFWLYEGLVCAPPSPTPVGQGCEFASDCAPGLLCVTAEVVPDCAESSCCAEFCSLVDPSCTQAGTECVPFFDGDPPPQYENVGICIVP